MIVEKLNICTFKLTTIKQRQMNNPVINTNDFKEKFIKGLELSFKKLLASKRLTDDTLIFSKNGKIVKIKARDIKD